MWKILHMLLFSNLESTTDTLMYLGPKMCHIFMFTCCARSNSTILLYSHWRRSLKVGLKYLGQCTMHSIPFSMQLHQPTIWNHVMRGIWSVEHNILSCNYYWESLVRQRYLNYRFTPWKTKAAAVHTIYITNKEDRYMRSKDRHIEYSSKYISLFSKHYIIPYHAIAIAKTKIIQYYIYYYSTNINIPSDKPLKNFSSSLWPRR